MRKIGMDASGKLFLDTIERMTDQVVKNAGEKERRLDFSDTPIGPTVELMQKMFIEEVPRKMNEEINRLFFVSVPCKYFIEPFVILEPQNLMISRV